MTKPAPFNTRLLVALGERKVTYELVSNWGGNLLLAENKQMSPGQIAGAVGRSVSRVSHVLAALRLAEVVRYETDGTRAKYRLKPPCEIRQFLQALSEFIDSASPSR